MANLAIQTLTNILKVQESWFNKSFLDFESKVTLLVNSTLAGSLTYREARRVIQGLFHDHPNAFSSEDINKHVREFTSSFLRVGYSRGGPSRVHQELTAYSGTDVNVDVLITDSISYLLNAFGSGCIAALIDPSQRPWEDTGIIGCYSELVRIGKRHYPLGLSIMTPPINRVDPKNRTPVVDLFYRNIDEMYSILDRINELPNITNTKSINYGEITVYDFDSFEGGSYTADDHFTSSITTEVTIRDILKPKVKSIPDSSGYTNRFSVDKRNRVDTVIKHLSEGTFGGISELLDGYVNLIRNGLTKTSHDATITDVAEVSSKRTKLFFLPGYLVTRKSNAETVERIYSAINEAMAMTNEERNGVDHMNLVREVIAKLEIYVDDSAWSYSERQFIDVSTNPFINVVTRLKSDAYWRGVSTLTQLPVTEFMMLSDECFSVAYHGYLELKDVKGTCVSNSFFSLVSDMAVAISDKFKIKLPKQDKAVAICDLPLFIRPNKTIEENLIALGFTLTKKETNNESANKPAKAGRRNRKD